MELEKEKRERRLIEKHLYTVSNANEKEREELRRRSFECKVMSEEGILYFFTSFIVVIIIVFT